MPLFTFNTFKSLTHVGVKSKLKYTKDMAFTSFMYLEVAEVLFKYCKAT